MSHPRDLDWFRRRLVLHEAALLTEEEEERFRLLLGADAACRELFERFQATSPTESASGEHVSAYKIARWSRSKETLRGIERRLIREHLETCAECRADLVALGHEPALRDAPELESTLSAPPFSDAATAGDETHRRSLPPGDRPHRESKPGRNRFFGQWGGMGGWLVAAAAGLGWLFVTLQNDALKDVAIPEHVIRNLHVTSLGVTVRGQVADEVPTVPISPDGQSIAVHVSANQGYPLPQMVTVRFLDKTGREIASRQSPFEEVCSPNVLFLISATPLQVGRHVLRIEPVDEGTGLPPLEFPLELTEPR